MGRERGRGSRSPNLAGGFLPTEAQPAGWGTCSGAPPALLGGHSGTESPLPRTPLLSFSKRLALQFRFVFAEPNQYCKHTEGVFIFLESKITKQHIRREAFNSVGSFLLLGIKVMIISPGFFQATHRSGGKCAASAAQVTSARGERRFWAVVLGDPCAIPTSL